MWSALAPLVAAFSFGVVAWCRGRRVFAAVQCLVSATTVAGFVGILSSGDWLEFALSPTRLVVAIVLIVSTCLVGGVAAAIEWHDQRARTTRRSERWIGAAGLATAMVAVAVPAFVACYVMVPQIRIAQDTFVSAPVAEPHPLEEPAGTTAAPPATVIPTVAGPSSRTPTSSPASGPSSSAASSASSAAPSASSSTSSTTSSTTSTTSTTVAPAPRPRLNVLLLGGDAGPGRWGLRTDSVNLVSIDLDTGDAAIIGIPRNLSRAPMPPGPLRDRYPKGFTDIFNALYPWGSLHPRAVEEALGPTDDPGASLVAASAAELLGVRIDAWVLIDMAGFIDVIDALGGLDVYVPKTIPSPGNPPTAKHPVKSRIEAGWHFMDGTDALSYARSRDADSDYARMARQRCLLASLAAQKDPIDLAVNWLAVSRVIADRVRTNLDPDQLRSLIAFAGGGIHNDRALALTPPLVPGAGWDPAEVRALVHATIHDEPYVGADGELVVPTTNPRGEAPTSGAVTIGEVCVTQR